MTSLLNNDDDRLTIVVSFMKKKILPYVYATIVFCWKKNVFHYIKTLKKKKIENKSVKNVLTSLPKDFQEIWFVGEFNSTEITVDFELTTCMKRKKNSDVSTL